MLYWRWSTPVASYIRRGDCNIFIALPGIMYVMRYVLLSNYLTYIRLNTNYMYIYTFLYA